MYRVGDFLADAVAKRPDQRAFLADSKMATFRELSSKVADLTARLYGLDIKNQDKVAILSPNSLDWFAIQLAVAEMGAVLVPLNTRFKKLELQYVLKQSDASILLVVERTADRKYFQLLKELFPRLLETGHTEITSDEFPQLRHVIADWDGRGLIETMQEVSGAGAAEFPRSAPDDVVLMQYTSGTTSFPKGVMLPQSNILRNAFNLGERIGLGPNDLLFSPLPFAHVGGSVLTNLLALTHGAGILTMGKYDPKSALELIEKHRPSAINGIDSHFIDIYTNSAFDRTKFPAIRRGWMVGSAEVVRRVIEDLGISQMVNVYGLSEASPNVTSNLPTDSTDTRCNTHGKTYHDMEVRIVDPTTGKTLAPRVSGEIHVRGYSLMKGYYKKPNETAAAIDREGWLHTGDRGFLNEDGYLIFEGRIKDVLRVGGENVSALEVEDVLLSHPKLKLAAVIGIPDNRLGEVCCAYVQLRAGAKTTEDEIIKFCTRRIASFKVPRVVRIVDSMPLTESGKIQKFKLREDAMTRAMPSVGDKPA